MSHFTVAVIDTNGDGINGDGLYNLLEPFNENLREERDLVCTKEQLLYELKNGEYDWKYDDVDDSNREEFRELAETTSYYIEEFDENDNGYNYYNPNAKWDWWTVGGRWSNLLKKKDGTNCDSCLLSELDLSLDTDSYNHAIRFWEINVEGQHLKEGENTDDYWSGYKSSYYIDTYETKENYAEKMSKFSTFALLIDDQWYEQGSMGYFGVSSATSSTIESYYEFFDKKLNELIETNPNATITIVDCHI